MRSRDINQGTLSADVAGGKITAASLRPYKGWGRISHREQSYSSVYHGLQIGLNRRFHAGLGSVTSERSPRTMQLSLRVTF